VQRATSEVIGTRAELGKFLRQDGHEGRPAGPVDAPVREGGLATRTRPKLERPARFKVLLFNDDYTPMEFVVNVLEQVFRKSPAEATQLMLTIHRSGLGVAGVYVLEVAETKVATVHQLAEERGYPLRAGVEKE
jgi:ATP-dependent Clp protease adaptor protein ClpS